MLISFKLLFVFFKPDIDHNLLLDICLERKLKNSKNMKNNQNTRKKKIRCRKNYCAALRYLIKIDNQAKDFFLDFLNSKCIEMALDKIEQNIFNKRKTIDKIKQNIFNKRKTIDKNVDPKKSESYLVWPLQYTQNCIEYTEDEVILDYDELKKKYGDMAIDIKKNFENRKNIGNKKQINKETIKKKKRIKKKKKIKRKKRYRKNIN